MKKMTAFLQGIILSSVVNAHAVDAVIIPRPVSIEEGDGVVELDRQTGLVADQGNDSAVRAAIYFAQYMEEHTGITFDKGLNPPEMGILFTAQGAPADLPPEGYLLNVATNGITVRARDYGGFFYGIQTMLQLMPAEVFGSPVEPLGKVQVSCAQISDWPRFTWRGMLLDCSRQFFTVEEVKRYIDHLAIHKINVFHFKPCFFQGLFDNRCSMFPVVV